MRRSLPLLAALLLAGNALPARAVPRPEVLVEVGRSFAVDSPVSGAFDQGGFSTALSAVWPFEDRFRFGASIFANDLGSLRAEVIDVSKRPPESLGVFDLGHANVYSGAWRLEVSGPRLSRFGTFACGSWGAYWFRSDVRGRFLGEAVKVGWNLGGGIMLPVRDRHEVGLTLGFDRVFHEFTRDFMSAALAWRWRPDLRPQGSRPKR